MGPDVAVLNATVQAAVAPERDELTSAAAESATEADGDVLYAKNETVHGGINYYHLYTRRPSRSVSHQKVPLRSAVGPTDCNTWMPP